MQKGDSSRRSPVSLSLLPLSHTHVLPVTVSLLFDHNPFYTTPILMHAVYSGASKPHLPGYPVLVHQLVRHEGTGQILRSQNLGPALGASVGESAFLP